MKIVYFSQVSNNTTRLVQKTGLVSVRIPISGDGPEVNEPYILLCPTYQMAGGVPHQVRKWLIQNDNWHWMQGVIATGNRNFAGNFGQAGYSIATEYGTCQLMEPIEMSGTKSDVIKIKELATRVEYSLSRV